jgi:hypothetical protein
MKKNMSAGSIAYMVGFFGAIIVGILGGLKFFEIGPVVSAILVVAGIVIGLVNIMEKEAMSVMIAALIIGAGAGILASLPLVGEFIGAIMAALAMVILPAALVVAFKTVMTKAK